VEGNEWVDKVVKAGGRRNQSEADIDMGSAFQHLRQFTVQSWYEEFEKMAESKLAILSGYQWLKWAGNRVEIPGHTCEKPCGIYLVNPSQKRTKNQLQT